MLAKKIIVARLNQLFYSLLLVCVGGLGPLTYAEALSPHQGVRTYRIVILERVRRLPATPPDFVLSLLRQQLLGQAWGQTDFVSASSNVVPGLARFFESGLSQGYLLTSPQPVIVNYATPGGKIAATPLTGRSAWLAPPDKPPIIPQLNLF
jgi:hypothetical protein